MDVIDAPAQLALLSKIVDSNQQSLAFTRTVGVLEGITVRSAMAELLWRVGRRRP